jgi:hypothetical protein
MLHARHLLVGGVLYAAYLIAVIIVVTGVLG